MKTFRVGYFSMTGEEVHAYQETWDKTACFCPHCGKQEVWRETSPGDYYVGPRNLCVACSHGFYIPEPPNDQTKDEQGQQRILALKS